MKIAIIGQKGAPAIYGGIERHTEEIAKQLAKQGHEVLLYARKWYAPKNTKRLDGIKIVHTPCLRTKHWDAFTHTFTSSLHAIFNRCDIIHYHGVGPSLLSWLPRLLSPETKVIATVHCLDRYHKKWGFLARAVLHLGEWCSVKFPHAAISVSKTIQNYLLNEYGAKTKLIPNGVKIPHGPKTPTKQKYIFACSRLIPHKGVHYLISAWIKLTREQPELVKNYKLKIAGGSAYTDKYVQELRNMAKPCQSIELIGWKSGEELKNLYKNTSLFVHPSENEGLPISILEAMSFGKAVLCSDISEHREVITDSRFWFHNTDTDALSRKIAELLPDKKLLKEAGEKNLNSAKRYGWEKIANDTLEIYQSKEPLKKPQTIFAR